MGMSVYVMRHGRAESGAGMPDEARRLSTEGMRGMAMHAQGLKRMGVRLDCILSSPLIRAWQTAEAVQQAVAPSVVIQESAALGPETQPPAVLRALLQLEKATAVLVVGHLPGIAAFLRTLVVGEEGAGFNVEPATIARVDFGGAPRAGGGTLRWMLNAEHLEKLGASTGSTA